MEKSKRLDTDIVVRQTLIDGTCKITIAETQNDWWIKEYKTCDKCCYDILDDDGNVMEHICA